MSELDYDVVVIGSGISGLSAAIYAGRAGNSPLVIKGSEPGGQLTLTTDVANYPGFPEGISGPELINRMNKQARNFGASFSEGIVEDIDRSSNNSLKVTLSSDEAVITRSIIVASGASAKMLGVPGEEDLMGYGVSTCATCDGAFFRDDDMIVVGGGDAALEEASFLTKFADTVYLVHRRKEFRAEEYWVNEVKDKVGAGDIELVLNSELNQIDGSKEEGIESVQVIEHPEGYPSDKEDEADISTKRLDVEAVFVAIGHTPNTDFLDNTPVKTDESGYIQTLSTDSTGGTETDMDGVFAAGDVVDYKYQQAATASGMGVKAALDVDSYLD